MSSLQPGTRVRVNDSFPYSAAGREGTVARTPSTGSVEVRFDDEPDYVVKWHRSYFDIVERI